ncbi:MAG: hypothetical protein R2818_04450 [Flavobacteriales bacterium]
MSNSYIIGHHQRFQRERALCQLLERQQVFTLANTTIAHNFNLYANTIRAR